MQCLLVSALTCRDLGGDVPTFSFALIAVCTRTSRLVAGEADIVKTSCSEASCPIKGTSKVSRADSASCGLSVVVDRAVTVGLVHVFFNFVTEKTVRITVHTPQSVITG